MPPQHRRDMIAVVFAAVLSSTYFVGLAILMQPIPSRGLAARVLMPNPAVSFLARLDTHQSVPIETSQRVLGERSPGVPTKTSRGVTIETSERRPPREHVVQPLRTTQLASVSELPLTADVQAASSEPQLERRRNFFVRIFHGVFRAGPTPALKMDVP